MVAIMEQYQHLKNWSGVVVSDPINFTSLMDGHLQVEVYRYIRSTKYRLTIWQNLVFFEIVQIYVSTNIFTCTNNLMHCLIVTILCCVDDHFTSFVAVLLLSTMVCSEFCCST